MHETISANNDLLLRRMSPLLAQSQHAQPQCKNPLLGVERTWAHALHSPLPTERTFPFAPHMSAFEGKVDIDQTYRFVRL